MPPWGGDLLARLLFRWLAASEAKMPAPKQRASRMQLAGIGQQGSWPGQHLRLAQGRRQAEGSAAHSPTREPRLRTVRHPRHLHHALQGRHQTRNLFRISRGRPNLLDLIHDKEVQWIVNTTESTRSESSENASVFI